MTAAGHLAMPAKDTYHEAVRAALVKDGWTITHDPYTLSFGQKEVYVDLGAERPIAAEKSGRRIAVEVKSFVGASEMRDLEVALGQYVLYRSLIARLEPDRDLYLAVPDSIVDGLLTEAIARPVIEDCRVNIVAYDAAEQRIVRWTPPLTTAESSAT